MWFIGISEKKSYLFVAKHQKSALVYSKIPLIEHPKINLTLDNYDVDDWESAQAFIEQKISTKNIFHFIYHQFEESPW